MLRCHSRTQADSGEHSQTSCVESTAVPNWCPMGLASEDQSVIDLIQLGKDIVPGRVRPAMATCLGTVHLVYLTIRPQSNLEAAMSDSDVLVEAFQEDSCELGEYVTRSDRPARWKHTLAMRLIWWMPMGQACLAALGIVGCNRLTSRLASPRELEVGSDAFHTVLRMFHRSVLACPPSDVGPHMLLRMMKKADLSSWQVDRRSVRSIVRWRNEKGSEKSSLR